MGAIIGFVTSATGRYLLGAGAVLVVFLGAYHAVYSRGYAARDAECQAAVAASVIRAAEQARKIALQDAEVSAGFETTRTRIQTVYRNIEKEVIREIPADCTQCRIAPAGLGMLNDAISGRAFKTTPPGKSDQPLRVPESAPGRNIPRSGVEIGGVERKTL